VATAEQAREYFHTVFRIANLRSAFERVAAKRGAPGIDRQTIDQFGKHLNRNLHRLADDVLSSRYHPSPVRRVYVPKASGGLRPLGIPTVRDRVAQAAVHEYTQPTWESVFIDCSFAYRPGRSIFDAIDRIIQLRDRDLRWVAEGDIVKCFDSLSHDRLLQLWSARYPELSSLVSKWLTSGSVDGQEFNATTRGVPQGGVISPLLCNVYLHQLDARLTDLDHELVRYADDFVLLARGEQAARKALRDAADALSRIDLSLSGPKSRLCSFQEGFTFLGATFEGDEVERPRTGRYGGAGGAQGGGSSKARKGEPPASRRPVWLSTNTSPPDALPISLVATYAFCPRAFYLRQVCRERVDTPRMAAGRVQHRIRRMAGGAANLYFDVPVAAPSLGLRGRLDAVYAKWNTWVPIEFKFSRAERVHDSHRLQLAAQAVAIEETTAHSVLAGYVEFLPRQVFRCVTIDDELHRRLAAAVENMWDIMSSHEAPEPVDDARCRWCSMRPVCQPGLADQLEGMIA